VHVCKGILGLRRSRVPEQEGLGLGIATLGTVVCRNDVEGALGSVPPDAADAARESGDRAVAAAGQLPAEQGGDLLAAARDAFTSGVHTVGIVSAILYSGLAVLALRAFSHVRNSNGGEHDIPKKNVSSGSH
jgi:DHA2 family multidrug resistance protein-like MFS transporter